MNVYEIEWHGSSIITIISAESEDEAIAKFKAGINEKYRDDPDLIQEIREYGMIFSKT